QHRPREVDRVEAGEGEKAGQGWGITPRGPRFVAHAPGYNGRSPPGGRKEQSGETPSRTAPRLAAGRSAPLAGEARGKPPGRPLLSQPVFRRDVQPRLPGGLPAPERPPGRRLRAGLPARRRGPRGPGARRPPPPELRVGHGPVAVPRARVLGLLRERLRTRP